MSSSKAVVLNGGDFAPQGTGDNVWKHFLVVMTEDRGVMLTFRE